MTKMTGVTTIMRVVLGIIFLLHGITKFQMGLGNVDAWFSSMGIPGFIAYIAAIVEVAGGIMLIVGLYTRFVSALFILLMLGAIITVKLSAGLLGSDQMPGYEMEIGFMLISMHLLVSEPTPLSVDHMIRSKRSVS
ncbi:DoxX family protein [Brevibacillus daliensis]|uniref:DoxX family protein n=1 Tax=Brevibacillus daliensis TaxID=2892995 RepID=UPI001E4D9989|nr:DoxX family protein [Brevibacillus daliensis]